MKTQAIRNEQNTQTASPFARPLESLAMVAVGKGVCPAVVIAVTGVLTRPGRDLLGLGFTHCLATFVFITICLRLQPEF
jgi:hypothetical protein